MVNQIYIGNVDGHSPSCFYKVDFILSYFGQSLYFHISYLIWQGNVVVLWLYV